MTETLLPPSAIPIPSPSSDAQVPRLPRHHCDRAVSCYRLMGEDGLEESAAHIKDISQSGIALFMQVPFATETILGVEVHCPEGLMSYLLVGRVVRCITGNSGWLVGCAFDRRLSELELANLL